MEDIKTAEPAVNIEQLIINGYKKYYLMHGHDPESVYAFCAELNIEEAEFYDHFNSFDQIRGAYWKSILNEVINALKGSEEFPDFSVREKLLSFYYAFLERLKKDRSFALLSLPADWINWTVSNNDLQDLKKEFKTWIKDLVHEGMASGEVAGRSKFNDAYDQLFWMHFNFILKFWKEDKSRGFEKTDEAVEKSVALAFDLIEKNALDSAFDFGKFLFQMR